MAITFLMLALALVNFSFFFRLYIQGKCYKRRKWDLFEVLLTACFAIAIVMVLHFLNELIHMPHF